MRAAFLSPAGMLLLALAACTLAFFPLAIGPDLPAWLEWADHTQQYGLIQGYAFSKNEHPPLLSLIFWLSLKGAAAVGVAGFYGIRASFLLALLASLLVLQKLFRGRPYVILFFYGVLFYGSMVLSYMDIYFAPFFLWSFYCLFRGNVTGFVALFSVACLIKYPPLMISPFILLYVLFLFYAQTGSVARCCGRLVQALLPAFILSGVVLAVFGYAPIDALGRAFKHYGLTAQGLNLGYIAQSLQWFDDRILGHPDTLAGMDYLKGAVGLRIPFFVFYLATLVAFIRLPKTPDNLLVFCILGHMCYFIFNLGVHENHLFVSVLLAMLLCWRSASAMDFALGIIGMYCLNIFVFYSASGSVGLPYYSGEVLPQQMLEYSPVSIYPAYDVRLLLAVSNVVYFLVMWWYFCLNRHSPLRASFAVANP